MYGTFVEFLDENRGSSIFVGDDEDQETQSARLIVEAARFVHGSSGIAAFLVEEVILLKNGKEYSSTVAAMLTRAQGRAHETLRKNMVSWRFQAETLRHCACTRTNLCICVMFQFVLTLEWSSNISRQYPIKRLTRFGRLQGYQPSAPQCSNHDC